MAKLEIKFSFSTADNYYKLTAEVLTYEGIPDPYIFLLSKVDESNYGFIGIVTPFLYADAPTKDSVTEDMNPEYVRDSSVELYGEDPAQLEQLQSDILQDLQYFLKQYTSLQNIQETKIYEITEEAIH